jgi:omega-hydroxy-beta-dihydromenaquinone-9 sulfotransferase
MPEPASLVEKWMRFAGPNVLGGLATGNWLRLLARERLRVSPLCLPRAIAVSMYTPLTSVVGHYEARRYRREVEQAEILPPVFILGHWRQGTTHLHNLMCLDARFAYPTTFQCCFPHTFLTSEVTASRLIAPLFPPRRPMDNVEWNLQSPQEDEFALLLTTLCSPYLAWAFPRRYQHYRQYLTLRSSCREDVARWRSALLNFLKKLSWKYRRPLVLKSPTHTARIRLLLEMFPDARFIHIRRHPLDTFVSTREMMLINNAMTRLQMDPFDDLDTLVIEQYQEMYDAYFAERELIPQGRLIDVSFEDLEREPVQQLQSIYEALQLPDFSIVKPTVRTYLASIAGYQKNKFKPLGDSLKARVHQAWQRNFDEWGYSPDR